MLSHVLRRPGDVAGVRAEVLQLLADPEHMRLPGADAAVPPRAVRARSRAVRAWSPVVACGGRSAPSRLAETVRQAWARRGGR